MKIIHFTVKFGFFLHLNSFKFLFPQLRFILNLSLFLCLCVSCISFFSSAFIPFLLDNRTFDWGMISSHHQFVFGILCVDIVASIVGIVAIADGTCLTALEE